MTSDSRSLLVMSCSQRKREESGLLPAIERYDSPAFRVLRHFLRERPSNTLDIFIVSAKFGLISSNQLIPNYDQRMTVSRAQELNLSITAKLNHILSSQRYEDFCLCMGKDYLRTIDGYSEFVTHELTSKIITGPPGKKIAELYAWLYGQSLGQQLFLQAITPGDKTKLRGIEINATPVQVLEVARRALAEGQGQPTNYFSWYVQIDEEQVAPKWLVSQLLGLPLNAFTTSEACRLLAQLGIEVRHT